MKLLLRMLGMILSISFVVDIRYILLLEVQKLLRLPLVVTEGMAKSLLAVKMKPGLIYLTFKTSFTTHAER